VLCEITPGGVPRNISANRAAAIPGAQQPAGQGRSGLAGLAGEHLAGLRRIDGLLSEAREKITAAVKASGTGLTGVPGVGPVIAATVTGDVADVARFPAADKFASYNGTAPIEVSSGSPKIYRLTRARQPPPLPRHPHGRGHPDRAQAQRRPRLLPAQTRRGQAPGRGPSSTEAEDQQCHLRPHAGRRPPGSGPGRHPMGFSCQAALRICLAGLGKAVCSS
jgi:Transposase IS116/IS110/IS902 family